MYCNYLFNFAWKAFLQVLPIAANLKRWNRTQDPLCPLCASGQAQTNKHVLSNCSCPTALHRYTDRYKTDRCPFSTNHLAPFEYILLATLIRWSCRGSELAYTHNRCTIVVCSYHRSRVLVYLGWSPEGHLSRTPNSSTVISPIFENCICHSRMVK